MIYLVEKGENKSKYEILKAKYIESCKCNKLNIQYKDKVTRCRQSGLTPNTKARELLTLQFRPTASRL